MEAVLGFLRDTRVGCIGIRQKPPEEVQKGDEAGDEGEEDGPGPPQV